MEDKPTILVHRIPEFPISFDPWLSTRFTLLDPLDPAHSPTQAQAQLSRALITAGPAPVSGEVLRRYSAVELVVVSGAGVDHVDLSACRQRGVRVCNSGEAFSEDVADYGVGMFLDLVRKVSVADRFVRAGSWPVVGEFPLGSKAREAFSDDVADYGVGLFLDVVRKVSAADRFVRAGSWPVKGDFPLGSKVGGKRVGIVGLGSIGSLVAKRLESFNCHIAYNSRKKKPNITYPFYENVKDLATNSDALILCCALTDETHHMINEDVMTALGKEGVIVNIGRGALIDEKELVSKLVRGEIGGAGLEVFENEPHVPKELFDLDNVVMSPHTSVTTPESILAVQEVIIANLEAFFANKPLRSEVKLD